MNKKKETLKYKNFVNNFISIIAEEGLPDIYPEFFINFLREEYVILKNSSRKKAFENFEEVIFHNPVNENHMLRFNHLITLKLFCYQALFLKDEFINKSEESETSSSWTHQPIIDFLSCWSLIFGKSDWLEILLEKKHDEDQEQELRDFIWTCLFIIRTSFSALRLKYQNIFGDFSKHMLLNLRILTKIYYKDTFYPFISF